MCKESNVSLEDTPDLSFKFVLQIYHFTISRQELLQFLWAAVVFRVFNFGVGVKGQISSHPVLYRAHTTETTEEEVLTVKQTEVLVHTHCIRSHSLQFRYCMLPCFSQRYVHFKRDCPIQRTICDIYSFYFERVCYHSAMIQKDLWTATSYQSII